MEAPQVVRRGRTYTLLYSGAACCGKRCTYALGAAQSRSPLGPYRKLAANPILQSSRLWRCPGHAGTVSDGRGGTWLLYHAYPRRGIGYVGRQTLLDELRWRGGLPVVGRNRDPSLVGAAPADAQRPVQVQRDDFSGGRLSPMWQWEEDRRPRTRVADGVLDLVPRRSGPGRRERLFFATAPTAAFVAQTSVVGGAGGIGAFWTRADAVGIERVGDRVTAWTRRRGRSRAVASLTLPGPRVTLRLSGRYNRFSPEASLDGRNWRPVGPPYSAPVTEEWAFGTGLALTAATPSRFDWVTLRAGR
ncbi:MAG: family 43 glycosylhydrolase [Solirubrobacteraceae bacterium]